MVEINDFLKEVKELSINGKEVITILMELQAGEKGIPNLCIMNDNHAVFNIEMSEQVKNCKMNFSIYETGINSYLLDLVTFFPQDNYFYPPDLTPDAALFTINGAPLLGAHSVQKPLGAMSLTDAIETALEYVYENMENILKEALGGESIIAS